MYLTLKRRSEHCVSFELLFPASDNLVSTRSFAVSGLCVAHSVQRPLVRVCK